MEKQTHATFRAMNGEGQSVPLRLNLQLFAEGDPNPSNDPGGDPGNGNDLVLPKTAEELQKMLQSETDKRVTQALKTAQEKWQTDFEVKLKTEREEAERIAKLSAGEKEKELLKKQQDEIAVKERALAQRELELKTIDLLAEKKLPLEFKAFVLGADETGTKERIDVFQKLFQGAVETAVNERIKGKTPPPSGGSSSEVKGGDLGKRLAEQQTQSTKNVDDGQKIYFGN